MARFNTYPDRDTDPEWKKIMDVNQYISYVMHFSLTLMRTRTWTRHTSRTNGWPCSFTLLLESRCSQLAKMAEHFRERVGDCIGVSCAFSH